jgi:hypothetical protein
MSDNDDPPGTYRVEREGYSFRLDAAGVRAVKALPDYEGKEEPAVAEEFLKTRAEAWADALASAGARGGVYDVRVDEHQGKAHLSRAGSPVFSADL